MLLFVFFFFFCGLVAKPMKHPTRQITQTIIVFVFFEKVVIILCAIFLFKKKMRKSLF